MFQAKANKENLKEVTNKVFFDIEIDGKPAGEDFFFLIVFVLILK